MKYDKKTRKAEETIRKLKWARNKSHQRPSLMSGFYSTWPRTLLICNEFIWPRQPNISDTAPRIAVHVDVCANIEHNSELLEVYGNSVRNKS